MLLPDLTDKSDVIQEEPIYISSTGADVLIYAVPEATEQFKLSLHVFLPMRRKEA